ncbi:MAG: ABC transporter permease [Planctomycetota bacterium]|jgi:ABC-2 type transport system permease protein
MIRRTVWIIWKNTKLFVADWKALFFSYLLPVVLASITGLAFSGAGSPKGTPKLKVGLLDLDGSAKIAEVVRALERSDSLAIEPVETEEEAKNLVRKRKKLAVIVFPKGSGEKLADGFFGGGEKAEIRLLIDPSRQAERGMLQGLLVREVMKTLSRDMMNPDRAMDRMKKGLSAMESDAGLQGEERERWADFMRSGIAMFERLKDATETKGESARSPYAPDFSEPFRLAVEEVSGEKKGKRTDIFAQTFSGTGAMFLLFGVMGAALNLVQERQKGTLRRILTAPVTKVEVLGGEAIFYFLFSMSQLVVLFVAAKILFDIPFHGSKGGLVLISGATGIAVTGFGILIAAVGKTERQISGISVLVILVMSCLGGSWFPVWMMPEFMQTLASVTINKWAVMGFEGATWRGFGFVEILWPNAVVLLGMGALFFSLALWRFKWD